MLVSATPDPTLNNLLAGVCFANDTLRASIADMPVADAEQARGGRFGVAPQRWLQRSHTRACVSVCMHSNVAPRMLAE